MWIYVANISRDFGCSYESSRVEVFICFYLSKSGDREVL